MNHALEPEQHLRLPRRARAELDAVVLARQLMKQAGMDENDMADVEAALIEAVINAFEHGGADPVEVYYKVTPDAFQIRVEDPGGGFDPHAVHPPDAAEKRRRGETRGWGLAIVRRSMDRVDVDSGANGTAITMIKKR